MKEKVELNKSFTIVDRLHDGFKFEDIDKIIFMDKRNPTRDVLETDTKYINEVEIE